jgi:hypothetical protein
MLGPLVVSGVAVEVPDAAVGRCLWECLRTSTTNRIDRHDPRLPVLDSKRLYQRKAGLGPLERTALVAALAGGHPVNGFRALLGAVVSEASDRMDDYPWYRGFDVGLPLENDAGSLKLHANAVVADLRRVGGRVAGIFAEPLLEGRFNRLVANTRNKASVSMSLAFRVVQRAAAAAPGQSLQVLIDRQGGRTRYASVLRTAFDVSHIDILAESASRSAYALKVFGRAARVEFITEGEDHHFAIALAGIFSKYLRELYMSAFNQYWAGRVDGLTPTAGYYQDARRFLADIASVLDRDRIDRALLIRSR